MLRTLVDTSVQAVSAVGAHWTVVPGCLAGGCSIGLILAGATVGSVPVMLTGAAIGAVSALALLEAADAIYGAQALRRGVLATIALLGLATGPGSTQELTEAARARSELEAQTLAALPDAEALVDHVLQLARDNQAAAEVARSSRDQLVNGLGLAGDALAVDGFHPEDLIGPGRSGPVVYVFVSLGMPDEALQRYVREAYDIGAVVLIRGFVDQSFAATQARIAALFNEETLGGIAIDPRPFQAFGIDRVPAIVYAESQVMPCGDLGCVVETPEHHIVRGNITISAALELFGETAPVRH